MNIGYGINLCSKVLKNKLNTELESEGITASQFAVIKDIEKHSQYEEVTAVSIAERLDMDKPTVSGIINRLYDKKYIIKEPHSKDKRATTIKLSNEAINKLDKFEEINNEVLKIALKGVTKEDKLIVQKILNMIIDNLREE